MAEVQESGPLVGQNLTDSIWRGLFGDEPAIVGDTTGTAFGLTLPPASNSVELGSDEHDSLARVGGFLLKIPAGTTQSLEVPPAVNANPGRTDLIVARLDPGAHAVPPGPVRLHRIPGIEGSADRPAYDQGSPGMEDLPLWAITRRSGQALSQATVVDLRVRTGPHLLVPPSISPFPSMPLGSTTTRGEVGWERIIGENGAPVWAERFRPAEILDGIASTESAMPDWARRDGCRMIRVGKWRNLHLVARRTQPTTSNARGGLGDLAVARLHGMDRPAAGVPMAAYLKDINGATYMAGAHVTGTSGLIALNSTLPDVSFGPSGPDDTLHIHSTWYVP